MPAKPAKYCAKCRVSHANGCPQKKQWVRKYNAKSGRGGRPWQRLRKRIFQRDGFLCQSCKADDILTAVDLHGANVGICDHIIPTFEGGSDDESNLQTLCKKCSDDKTKQEAVRGRGVQISTGQPMDTDALI